MMQPSRVVLFALAFSRGIVVAQATLLRSGNGDALTTTTDEDHAFWQRLLDDGMSAPTTINTVDGDLVPTFSPIATPATTFAPYVFTPVPRPTMSPQQLQTFGPTSSFLSVDVIDGNKTLGHCYSVDMYSVSTGINPMTGCVFESLLLTYYGGGTNAAGIDTFLEQEIYARVFVDTQHSCADGQPDTCDLFVAGLEEECHGCLYLGDSLVGLVDSECTDGSESIFAKSDEQNQVASFFFDGDKASYDSRFFKLKEDPDRCSRLPG